MRHKSKKKVLTVEETLSWLHTGLRYNANLAGFTERMHDIFSKQELAAILVTSMQRCNRLTTELEKLQDTPSKSEL